MRYICQVRIRDILATEIWRFYDYKERTMSHEYQAPVRDIFRYEDKEEKNPNLKLH